ncbi:MAG: hypothetical protein ACYTHN_09275 [Planctomycetota bacterium]|jgi:hypothetical protein
MSRGALLGLVLLGGLFLASGCCHPYYRYHRYPARHAAVHHPGAFWTGVGLSAAGNAAVAHAVRASSPGRGLAALAVGAGLHAAAAGCLHAATAPPCRRRHVHYYYDRHGRCHRYYSWH